MKVKTPVTTEVKTAVPDIERPPLHLLDDPIQVDVWLASLGPDGSAGECREAQSCPLASYLHAANPEAEDWGVSGPSYSLDEERYQGDDWIRRFVEMVDEEPTTVVTAVRAREMLARAIDPSAPFTPPIITYSEQQAMDEDDDDYDEDYDEEEDEEEEDGGLSEPGPSYYLTACWCESCLRARDAGAMCLDA